MEIEHRRHLVHFNILLFETKTNDLFYHQREKKRFTRIRLFSFYDSSTNSLGLNSTQLESLKSSFFSRILCEVIQSFEILWILLLPSFSWWRVRRNLLDYTINFYFSIVIRCRSRTLKIFHREWEAPKVSKNIEKEMKAMLAPSIVKKK